MGACNSCEATAVAAAPGSTAPEARVVLADGALRRFPGGTRASQAVKAAAGEGAAPAAAWFLCSADGLELGGAAAGLGPEEALQPGQLYFVLPAAMQRRPLQAEEMAALAIRASAALVGDHDGPLVFPEAAAAGGGAAGARSGKACRRSRRGSSRGRDFVPDLGAIAE
ncbi:hypothetical protein GQ55_9G091300 [Panicum hallii var. hallii]|uniref:Uncharacterized protein n=1 Tax=Panicum hallii var. hallii TaxID=1504633 RepID=A0A2T7C195_9POAL|nr:hypothetical protein GQ55_9G091300 [Panicum hallii var. hallii]